jgi:predicted ABC-type ATPase
MDDRLRFALSDEEHETIFRREIVRNYLSDVTSLPEHPVAIILGGQPGAGKSGLLHLATERLLGQGNTVVINGDDFRSYHPDYQRLQMTDPLNAARYTDHDSGRWVEKTIRAAMEERVNLVIESTMRRAEVFEFTATTLREAGYRVEAHALAVPERLSWLGVHTRYEEMRRGGALPRFTAREAHDAGASGMLITLQAIEHQALADRVIVASREGLILYENERINGGWRQSPNAMSAVVQERGRPRSADERRAIDGDWQKVIDLMRARSVPISEIHQVAQQAQSDRTHFANRGGIISSVTDVLRSAAAAETVSLRPHTSMAARKEVWEQARAAEKQSAEPLVAKPAAEEAPDTKSAPSPSSGPGF